MNVRRNLTAEILLWAAVVACAGSARAEIFVLSNGSRLSGQLLNPDEKPRQQWILKTESGTTLTLDKSQVEQVLRPRPAEIEYEKIRSTYPDTAEGQWKLAQWCDENGLSSERMAHLERVIQLDPDHAQARKALGYNKVQGKWATQEEAMKERGYVYYKGRWRTKQDIEIQEQNEKTNRAEREWVQKVDRWKSALGTDQEAAARESLTSLTDPLAVKALGAALKSDPRPKARAIYVEALAHIGTLNAVRLLGLTSLQDPVEEVRLTCLDFLKKQKAKELISYYVSQLRSKDNVVVNRAAVALSRMNEPSVIGPLIDALVTTHKFTVGNSDPNRMSMGFSSTGGTGMMAGSSARVISQEYKNQEVLSALVALTNGVNYNFDVRAWKTWYASQKQRDTLDARRN